LLLGVSRKLTIKQHLKQAIKLICGALLGRAAETRSRCFLQEAQLNTTKLHLVWPWFTLK